MKLKTKLSKLRHDGYITDAEYAIIINVLNKFSTQQKVEQPCEDAISREAVRRILANQRDELVKLHTVNPKDNPKADAMAYGVNWSLNTLMELPSVKPSYNSIKIELEPCEDCVSREEAIRIAEQGQIQGYEWQFKKLCNLPSVTPQPKIGKWIDEGWYADGHSEHAYRCSECDEHHIGYVGEYKYCPNCGACMVESEE